MEKTEHVESSESIEKSQLLLLINEEISEIQKEESRPGWTMWALFGGLATCSWLLLDQIEKQIPQWGVLKIMLIAITLLSYSIKGFHGIINNENKVSSNERLITLRELFFKSKATLIILLSWFLFIIYFIINSGNIIPKWSLNLTYISIWLNIAFLFITLVMSFFNLVIPNTQDRLPKNKLVIFFVIFYFGIGILTSITWINYLLKNNLLLIYEFKISLLIIALAVLTILSVSVKASSQSLKSLIELRRDLILNTLPISQIKNQTDLILRGQSIQDYYSKDVNEVLASLLLFDKELFQAVQKIEIYQKNEKSNIKNKEKRLTQDALKESITKHLVTAAKIKFSQIDNARKRLVKKRAFLKGFYKVFKNDFTDREIISEVSDMILKNIDNYNDSVKAWHQLMSNTINQESAENMILELCKNVPELKYNVKTGDIEE